MNLDMKHPEQRFRNIFDAVRPALVVTRRDISGRIQNIAGDIPVLYLEDAEAMPDLDGETVQAVLTLRDSC